MNALWLFWRRPVLLKTSTTFCADSMPASPSRVRWFPSSLKDLKASYAKAALDSDEPDFEDGLVRAAAETEAAFAIITRDAQAFKTSSVPAMSAARYLELFGE